LLAFCYIVGIIKNNKNLHYIYYIDSVVEKD